jgi:putative two-component system response regulator
MAASMERLISPFHGDDLVRLTSSLGGRLSAAAARIACAEDGHDAALESLVARASLSDPEGADHPRRVGQIAAILAIEFDLDDALRGLLARAAALHDIGKLALPEGVLGHRHVLDRAARRLMEQHTILGANILAHTRQPWMRLAALIALMHHERWDGSGYPLGLVGEEIPLAARLVAVADVYDALRSERPYKDAQDHGQAMAALLEGDDRIDPAQFDPRVLDALRRHEAAIAAVPR